MAVSFEGQVVIVTGAGIGLGKAYAVDLARRGGAVIVNDVGVTVEGDEADDKVADRTVAEIRAAGGRAVASYDDVGSPDGGRRIVDTAIETFGRLDAVISNAGILRNAFIEDLRPADLDAILATHLLGAINVAQAAWPHMRARRYGRFVFASSGAGMLGNAGQSAYGAAKAGITGLMNVLSQEGEAHGILCNAVQPNALTRMVTKMPDILDAAAAARSASLTGPVAGSLTPEFNTAIAVYLASRSCATTHSIYSTVAGRIARVFVGVTTGWQGSRTEPSTADDIEANIDTIRALDRGFVVPADLMDEYALLLDAERAVAR